MIASITLLPALLGFARHRVEVTPLAGPHRRRLRRRRACSASASASRPLGGMCRPSPLVVLVASFFVRPLRRRSRAGPQAASRETFWYRWSRIDPAPPLAGVAHRPRRPRGAGAAGPRPAPRASPTTGNYAEGHVHPPGLRPARRWLRTRLQRPAHPGHRRPAGDGRRRRSTQVTDALAADPGVAFATPAPANDQADPTAALWLVDPRRPHRRTRPPRSSCTTSATTCSPPRRTAPGSTSPSPATPPPTSTSPTTSATALPIFFGAVLALSFLLLMAVFRSLLVPLKAVVMNLLSIGAAYGVVVAVFQWGWGGDLIGIGKGGPIEPFVPMMMFAIVFGLSMDYEVFLLSRIREEYDRTGDNATRRRRRPGRDGPGHHRRRRHHGVRVRQLPARGRPGRSSSSASAWPSPCCSTPPSSACSWCRPRWSCSATATGGCPAGSTGSCPRSTSRATACRPPVSPPACPSLDEHEDREQPATLG